MTKKYYFWAIKLLTKMKKILITLLFAMSFMAPFAQTNDLERVSPESEGIHSEDIIKLFDSMTNLPNVDLHSLVIMRHGKVVGEVYPAPFKACLLYTSDAADDDGYV